MIATCAIVLLSLGALLPAEVSGACSGTTIRYDWTNKRIGWSVTNIDKTQEQAEAILDGAQIVSVPDIIDRISVITDEITEITFDVARQIDALYVETKLTDSVTISGFDQSNTEVYTRTKQMADPNVNEGFLFDDFPTNLIKRVEVEPVLGQVSGEAGFKNLYIDACSTVPCDVTTQIDWDDRRNGVTVTNPDKAQDIAEAILFGTSSNPPSLITDEVTTIDFDSPRHVKNLYVESKFSNGVSVTIGTQTHTKYIDLADVVVNTAVDFNLLAPGAVSAVGIEPLLVTYSEGRLKNLRMDVCMDTAQCSDVTANDVSISPSRYANILTAGRETWITKNKPVLFTFNSPVNVKSIELMARRFRTDLQIIGKTSSAKEVFNFVFTTTDSFSTNPFNTDLIFLPASDPYQLSVSSIEMIAVGSTRGKVRDIKINMCPFSQ